MIPTAIRSISRNMDGRFDAAKANRCGESEFVDAENTREYENQGASRGERGHPNAKEAFRPGPLEYPPLEWIGWRPTRLRPIARAWKDSSLVLEVRCLDTYELLNK